MADSENASAPTLLSFDNWRQAINANIKGRDEYKAVRTALKLVEAAKNTSAEYPAIVERQLAGVAAGSPMANDMRDGLEFAHDICPDPWRGAFVTWLKHDAAAAEIIAKAVNNPEGLTYHGFVGDICESFGQALAAKGEHAVVSPYFNERAPNSVQYKARLSDGSWKDISQQELLALSRNPNGPHIVHSANHAFLDNQASDLDALQDTFSKLFDGSRLPSGLVSHDKESGHLSTWDAAALGPNDTITVFATHTRENRFLNLGQLFHRLDEVEHAQVNPEADRFANVAPIAADMVETLLKSIVVDSDVDKVRYAKDASFVREPITLRPDAIEILRRQRYRGFSKGGNDFRDGMRLLVHALEAKGAEGQPLVQSAEGFTTRDLVENVSTIVFGLNEKPMADYYREHGVTAPIIASKNDIIAPPTVLHGLDEPALNYVGKAAGDGHSPQYSVDGMLADWRIHDVLRMAGAVSQGQAAITDVNFVTNDAGGYLPNVLSLEVAPGTTDAMMADVAEQLNLALRTVGLTDTTLLCDASHHGRTRYRLQNNDNATKLLTPDNVEKVQKVLRSLSAQHKPKAQQAEVSRPAMPLWVSEAAAYEKISGIRRYLVLEEQGKLDQKTPYPVSIIDPASVTDRVRYVNEVGLREHPRLERGRQHARITQMNSGEQQIG